MELPPAFVLLVMWAAGVAILGSTALVLYSIAWVLVRSAAGAI